MDFDQIRAMFKPVRCRFCRRVYDLGNVEVTARYADCSMWKTPCCGRVADDRGETGWKTISDYEVIDKGRLGLPDVWGRVQRWRG